MKGVGGRRLGWVGFGKVEVGIVLTYLPRGSGVLEWWWWWWWRTSKGRRGSLEVEIVLTRALSRRDVPCTICSQTCAGVPVVKFSHIEVVWAVGEFIKESFISLKWEQMC